MHSYLSKISTPLQLSACTLTPQPKHELGSLLYDQFESDLEQLASSQRLDWLSESPSFDEQIPFYHLEEQDQRQVFEQETSSVVAFY